MKKILYILLFISINLNAQTLKSKLKQYAYTAPCFALSGIAGGVEESIKWGGYGYFKAKFPNSKEKYWNPYVSYVNKWKVRSDGSFVTVKGKRLEKFPFSSSILVSFTDGYHMTRAIKRDFGYLGLAVNGITVRKYNRKQKWYWYFIDVAVYSVVWSASFHMTYNWFQP